MNLFDPTSETPLLSTLMAGRYPILEWLPWNFGAADDLYMPLRRNTTIDYAARNITRLPRFTQEGQPITDPAHYGTLLCAEVLFPYLLHTWIGGGRATRPLPGTPFIRHHNWPGLRQAILNGGNLASISGRNLWEQLPKMITFLAADVVMIPQVAWKEAPEAWRLEGKIGLTPVFPMDGGDLWPEETTLNVYLLRKGDRGEFLSGRLRSHGATYPGLIYTDGGRFVLATPQDGMDTMIILSMECHFHCTAALQGMVEVSW